MGFENIPREMQVFDQWIVWRYEDTDGKKPTKVPYSALNGRLASVTDPASWASFDACVSALSSNLYSGIGFVLTEADPYLFIDLDDTEGDQTAFNRQVEIYNEFNSYAEKSPSGNGLHIICKGSIPSGRRRSHIEIYSSQRYMTMTGDVYRDAPIVDCYEAANILWEQLNEGRNSTIFYAGLEAAKLTDAQVLEIAGRAANAEKFNDLFYEGAWHKYYPSQSEADFALIDIIAFYSENRQQVQKLFLQSALGQREKSRAQYRINYVLDRCFDRMLPPVDIDGLRNKIEEAIAQRNKNQLKPTDANYTRENEPEQRVSIPNECSVPPGLVGEIAQFIYEQAPRPVAEIALAGALGLVAGIAGRSYNISGTGLNQYVLLLAPTGTGKEAISSGIDKLMAQVLRTVPAASDFVGPGEIASAQAIIKYMAKGPTSFVSMVGEFGLYLQQMAAINAPPHLVGLRRFMLDVFNKSGEGKVLRPSIYSDKDKNTASVLSPAFSMLGESTPEKFYEGLHEGLITEGLLPRFTLLEYHGIMPPLNKAGARVQPSFQLIDRLSTLCAHSLMLNSQHKAIEVRLTVEAERMADEFDEHCRSNVNSSDRDVRRNLWSRAHMKALKLAGIIAVGCEPLNPEINRDVLTWSINLILSDVRNLLKRFDAGEIGIDNDETKQLAKVVATMRDFILLPWPEVSKYAGDGAGILHSHKIVPYSYIQRRLACVSVFKKDRAGSTVAIKRALKTLGERGDAVELSRSELQTKYDTIQVAYMIKHNAAFNL